MTTMSHLWQAVRGGLNAEDDMEGTFLKGKATGQIPVTRLWFGIGGWLLGGPTKNPAWTGMVTPAEICTTATTGTT